MNADYGREVSKISKVAIVGPECTGKTSLAQMLAEHFHTEWVPEYARGFLSKMMVPYTEGDLLTIAQGQMRIEDEFYRDARRVLICDTNLVVMKVWSEFKFGRCHPWILEELKKRQYDLYILANIDVPWVHDPQREHPDKREELFVIYKRELSLLNTPVVEISGDENERKRISTEAIDKLLANG